MTSSKKKEKKKRDFQKTKLKVGRKIAKGNAIDTTFKTRKIQIRDPLRGRELSSGTVRKNIEEICKQLKTQNPQRRLEALRCLKDSLQAFPEAMLNQLYMLVPHLATTVTDADGEVRRSALPVLRYLFSHVPYERAVPFLPMLSAHLRCAINHLHQEVQHDSLPFLDALLEIYPEYVGLHSRSLIEDFLQLISKKRQSNSVGTASSSSNPSTDSHFSVILSSDPSRRLTSATWHLRVAQRMQRILAALLGNSETKRKVSPGDADGHVAFHSLLQPGLRPATIASDNKNHLQSFFEDTQQMQSFFSNIMPLLYQMWIEAGTIDSSISTKKIPPCDQMQFYSCIVEVITTLLTLLDKWVVTNREQEVSHLYSWFSDTFGKAFLSHCMGEFPYSEINQPRKAKNAPILNNPKSMTAVMINLHLCDILTRIFHTVQPRAGGCLEPAIAYILYVLADGKRSANQDNVEIALRVVHRLLCMPQLCDTTKDELLRCFIGIFEKTEITSKIYRFYLTVLSEVLLSKNSNYFRDRLIDAWVFRFTGDLLSFDIVPWDFLEIMKKIGSLNNHSFLVALQDLFPKLLERLPMLVVEQDRSCLEGRKIIINYIHWLPSLNRDLFSVLAKLCLSQKLELTLISYVLDLLTIRYLHNQLDSGKTICTDFLSFLFSITLGCSLQHLKELQKSNLPDGSQLQSEFYFQNRFEFLYDSSENLEFYHILAKMGIEKILLVIFSGQPLSIAATFLADLLGTYRVYPTRCLHSILTMVSSLWTSEAFPTFLLPVLMHLFTAYMEVMLRHGQPERCFQEKIAGLMNVGSLSDFIVNRLFTIANSGDFSSDSCVLLENIICSVLKECSEKDTKTLEEALTLVQIENLD